MKKALVRRDIPRFYHVVAPGQEFPVQFPQEWIDCADDVLPETHQFDGQNFSRPPAPPPMVPLAMARRDRERNIEKLEKAIADGNQGVTNELMLKILKESP